jgi:toxin ParE1/3/4
MDQLITRRPEVRRDLVGIADYISGDSADAGERFLAAAEQTFQFLAINRGVGQLCEFADPACVGMRAWPVDGFRNHLIFYRTTEEGVEIVRVLHGARDIEALFG